MLWRVTYLGSGSVLTPNNGLDKDIVKARKSTSKLDVTTTEGSSWVFIGRNDLKK